MKKIKKPKPKRKPAKKRKTRPKLKKGWSICGGI